MATPFESSPTVKAESGRGAALDAELSLLSAQIIQENGKAPKTALQAAIDWLDPLELSARAGLLLAQEHVNQTFGEKPELSQADKDRLAQEVERSRLQASSLASLHHAVEPYFKEGIKTAALFMRGRSGLATTIAAFALDECNLNEKREQQAAALALGSLKGLGMKLIFGKTGELDAAMKLIPIEYNLPVRATVLGTASRAIDVGLSRATWVDPQSAGFNPGRASQILGSQLFNPVALGTDIAAFGLSGGLVKGGNHLTGGALERSPLLSTMVVGSGFGISAGGSAELARQQRANERLDLNKIASHALTQGAVDAVAAIPGGKQADRQAGRILDSLNIPAPHAGRALPRVGSLQRAASVPLESNSTVAFNSFGVLVDEARLVSIAPKPAQPPAELQKRLLSATNGREGLIEAVELPGVKFRSHQDFVARAVRKVEHPVRVYKIDGHATELMVPEEYADVLDGVRRYRLHGVKPPELATRHDGFFESALPEDFIPHLDGLPNSTLVKRVNILNQDEPSNSWFRQSRNDPTWTALANAHPNGTTSFFKASRFHDLLHDNMNHEWTHHLHYRLPEDFRAYSAAVQQENALSTGWNARPYAATNEMENWAVHLGEELLAYDGLRMLNTAANAPLRTAVLARALKWSLNDAPQPERCEYRPQFNKRIEFIEKRITARAIKKLQQEISQSESLQADKLALLEYLTSGSYSAAAPSDRLH